MTSKETVEEIRKNVTATPGVKESVEALIGAIVNEVVNHSDDKDTQKALCSELLLAKSTLAEAVDSAAKPVEAPAEAHVDKSHKEHKPSHGTHDSGPHKK